MDNFTRNKIFTTIALMTTVFLHGLLYNTFFTTLLDFQEILGTSMENVSFGVTLRNIGACFGSIVAGFLYKRRNRQFIYSGFVILEGLSSGIIPNVQSIYLHHTLQFLIGASCGALESGVLVSISKIWNDKAAPYINTLVFVARVAATLSPLAMHPFLSIQSSKNDTRFCSEHNDNTAENTTFIQMLFFNETTPSSMTELESNVTGVALFNNDTIANSVLPEASIVRKSRIWLPLSVMSLLMIFSSTLVILQEYRNLRHANGRCQSCRIKSETDVLKPETATRETNFDKIYRLGVVTISCLLIALFWGFVLIFKQFWMTFVVYSDVRLSKSKAVIMLAGFTLATAVGSLLGIFVSMKVRPFKMLSLLCLVIIGGNVIHFIYAKGPETMLWVGGILLTTCLGSFYASIYNCLQERVEMTDGVGSAFMLSALITNACGLPLMIGSFIECFPSILIYFNLSTILVIACLIALLGMLDRWHNKTLKRRTRLPKPASEGQLSLSKKYSICGVVAGDYT